MSPVTPSTFSCHSVMLCIVLLLAHHIQPVNSHYYGSCIGSRDRSKAEASVCTTDDIYVYVNILVLNTNVSHAYQVLLRVGACADNLLVTSYLGECPP